MCKKSNLKIVTILSNLVLPFLLAGEEQMLTVIKNQTFKCVNPQYEVNKERRYLSAFLFFDQYNNIFFIN